VNAYLAAAALALMIAGTAAAQTPQDQLPPGPGRETVLRVCSGCHSPDVVAGQSADRAGWADLVASMVGRGAAASDDDVKTIVDYLAKAFPLAASTPATAAPAH
jgi:competence protein ComEA